jgi:hypothetical protein
LEMESDRNERDGFGCGDIDRIRMRSSTPVKENCPHHDLELI